MTPDSKRHNQQENSETPDKNRLKMATGDTFRVRRYNELNWVLELFKPGEINPFTGKIGQDKWIIYGYFGQLSDVARRLINQSVAFADGTSGQEVLNAIRQAEKAITEALKTVL